MTKQAIQFGVCSGKVFFLANQQSLQKESSQPFNFKIKPPQDIDVNIQYCIIFTMTVIC